MANKKNKQIEDSVLTAAEDAVLSVQGVAGFSSVPLQFSIRAKESSKGIVLNCNDDDELICDVFIDVKLGIKIPQTAFAVQESVKKAIDSISDIKVSKINIHVQGIDFEENEKN